jgi:hypothetical protein
VLEPQGGGAAGFGGRGETYLRERVK